MQTKNINQAQENNILNSVSQVLDTTTLPDSTANPANAVVEVINTIVADMVALFVKVKNFHWHLNSANHHDYHTLFDEHANQLIASIDLLTEQVRHMGTTLRSIGHIQKLSAIPNDNTEFVGADDMLQRLLKDNLNLARQLRNAIELTQEKQNFPARHLLIDLLDDAEKRIWFYMKRFRAEKMFDR